MAHIGQEFGFGARGGFGGDAGGFEFAVGLGQLVLQQFIAKRRADTRPEFGDFVRLGDVIHGAQLETAQLVGGAVPRRENDDGDRLQVGVFLQLLQHGEPVVFGKAKVEQDDIDFVATRQRQAIASVAGAQKLDIVLHQAGDEQLVQILIVINQQNLRQRRAHVLMTRAMVFRANHSKETLLAFSFPAQGQNRHVRTPRSPGQTPRRLPPAFLPGPISPVPRNVWRAGARRDCWRCL